MYNQKRKEQLILKIKEFEEKYYDEIENGLSMSKLINYQNAVRDICIEYLELSMNKYKFLHP